MPNISVILPVYNGEKYLNNAIESIVTQSYKNFELIIINDGSTDGSQKIIEKYSSQDKRIKASYRENKGLVFTLNEAIDFSEGDWIARMDQDDISLSTRLEKQLQYAQKTDSDFCGTWADRFGYGGNSIWRMPISETAIRMYLLFGCPLIHPSIIGRASAFRHLKYDPAFEAAEDYDLWVRAAIEGYSFSNIPEVLLKYRVHEFQMTKKFALTQKNLSQKVKEKYWLRINREYSLGHSDAVSTFNFMNFNFDEKSIPSGINSTLLKIINSEKQNVESKDVLIKGISDVYIWASCSSSGHRKLWNHFKKDLELGNIVSTEIKIFLFRLLQIRYGGRMHFLFRNLKFYIFKFFSNR